MQDIRDSLKCTVSDNNKLSHIVRQQEDIINQLQRQTEDQAMKIDQMENTYKVNLNYKNKQIDSLNLFTEKLNSQLHNGSPPAQLNKRQSRLYQRHSIKQIHKGRSSTMCERSQSSHAFK